MRAVVLRDGRLEVADVAEPTPGPGQVLLEPVACGICGSDLHCARHARAFTEAARLTGMTIFDFDPDRDLVMGHEFSARVLEPIPAIALNGAFLVLYLVAASFLVNTAHQGGALVHTYGIHAMLDAGTAINAAAPAAQSGDDDDR